MDALTQNPPPSPCRCLLVVVVVLIVRFIFIKMRRHPFGMAKTCGSKAKGACNQGKKDIWEQIPRSRGNSAPSVTTGENQGLRGETPYKAQSPLCVSLLNFLFLVCSVTATLAPHHIVTDKKKAPVIGFLVPFCVKHSKGFFVSLMWPENYIPLWWLDSSKSFQSMPK